MLTWLAKSYAKFNLFRTLFPLLEKIKQIIIFKHLDSIVKYYDERIGIRIFLLNFFFLMSLKLAFFWNKSIYRRQTAGETTP
jgi:hypothetical protein